MVAFTYDGSYEKSYLNGLFEEYGPQSYNYKRTYNGTTEAVRQTANKTPSYFPKHLEIHWARATGFGAASARTSNRHQGRTPHASRRAIFPQQNKGEVAASGLADIEHELLAHRFDYKIFSPETACLGTQPFLAPDSVKQKGDAHS
jgi:hypothetical protein